MNRDICADVLKRNAIHGTSSLTRAAPASVAFNQGHIQLDSGLSVPILEVESAIRGDMDMGGHQYAEMLIGCFDRHYASDM